MGTRNGSKLWEIPQATTALIGPYSVSGGIYDFSGTQDNHVYHETGVSVSKAEIADWTRMWWDGQSDSWTTDAQFQASRKDETNPFKLVIGGKDYRIMRRATFGEGDQQHVIFGRSKDKD